MEKNRRKGRSRGEKNLTWLAVAALLMALFCMVNLFCDDEADYNELPPPPAVAVAADSDGEGPRIVGGFVPKQHNPVEMRKSDTVFLSWNFINGLFALILVFEFLVVPILMWLWFGKKKEPSP
ncbi:hypothetical protein [Selenomonas ruminantium]|uniref:hypothetical protein n=1 Tax=Selenomonas ruminantium TaxID=971 RepID=UPI0026EB03C5|nr:hypothetical protein [Selenomonas ruminantium]